MAGGGLPDPVGDVAHGRLHVGFAAQQHEAQLFQSVQSLAIWSLNCGARSSTWPASGTSMTRLSGASANSRR